MEDDREILNFKASEAAKLAKTKNDVRDINYNLTIVRVLRAIKGAAEGGATWFSFTAPAFVLDGCLGDPILLAKQLKKKLESMGYTVKREVDVLMITWS